MATAGVSRALGEAANDSPPEPQRIPGAYLAPSASYTSPLAGGTSSSKRFGTPATVTALRPPGPTVPSMPAPPVEQRWFSQMMTAQASRPASAAVTAVQAAPLPAAALPAGEASMLADLPITRPRGVAGWCVAAGGLITAFAFVLPWALNGVPGTSADPSYLGRWGLANPSQLLLLAVALATAGLALTETRVPMVIRGVLLPLVLGGFFSGLMWSYVTGPYGTGPGTDAMALGGVLLLVGGGLGLRAHRNGAAEPGV